MSARYPKGTPEHTVLHNSLTELSVNDWLLGIGGSRNGDRIQLALGLPDSMRMLSETVIGYALGLAPDANVQPGEDGYRITHENSDDRTYFVYNGAIDQRLVLTLADLVSLNEDKPMELHRALATLPYEPAV